jgi:hypothetical protein
MIANIETAASGFIAVSASLLGSKTTRMLADVTNAPMPDWMTWLVGPLGALVGLVIALKWMSARLDRTEAKSEAKELARDKESKDERDRLIIALERSTVAMDGVKSVIETCHGKRLTGKQSEE